MLGLRGGLGKTLLIAFLLLAIVPLSFLAFLTYNQIQYDTGQKLFASLETVVALKEAHLLDWVESCEHELVLLADALEHEAAGAREGLDQILGDRLEAIQAVDPTFTALIWIDESSGQVIAVPDSAGAALNVLQSSNVDGRRLIIVPTAGTKAEGGSPDPLLAVSHTWAGGQLIGLLSWDSLRRIVTTSDDTDKGTSTYLATADGWVAFARGLTTVSLDEQASVPRGMSRALHGQSGSDAYTDLSGTLVFGAYRWIPELQVALLAEHSKTQALAAGNTLTAMVLGATLGVALITAAIAAVVTRRLTRPIVRLTQTAAWMARGNLNQQVSVTRKDEIGVLARAFNRMAAELRVLYDQLEAKVAERTQQLEEAHQRTRHYAMRLAISAEVARVASSIRDVDTLLTTVTELIGSAFELRYVSIYLLDSSGRQAVWKAGSGGAPPLGERKAVGGQTLVGRVAADGQQRVRHCSVEDPESDPKCEIAIPLRARQRVLGVLHLQSDRPGDFGESDGIVYQSLSDQIGVAIENARAYAVERETVERLRKLDRIQAQFLTNMSHALRTPLNSVIGFSRIMLKELDGPLNDMQRTDLTTIHQSGRRLLGLINDMLEMTQLELGTVPFSLAEVDLTEIIEGVMATSRALALSKPIRLFEQVPDDLPLIYTDGQRVRQVILALLSNAVKFTDEGSVGLCVIPEGDHVIISVHDTGIGIPPTERARIFWEAQYDEGNGSDESPGFGLAISRRVVERLGGRIWVESEAGVGSIFSFTLPIKPDKGEPPLEQDSEEKE
jgi:signal transduction histidine kinase/HAMP domain-containing protein